MYELQDHLITCTDNNYVDKIQYQQIWKISENAPDAAEAMGVTSAILQDMDIVDATIEEPLGGAHRNPELMAERIRSHIIEQLDQLQSLPLEDMLSKRYARLMSYGN